MNDLTERLRELAAISDTDSAQLVSDRTRADLADMITAAPPAVTGQDIGAVPAAGAAGRARATASRRWLAGLPLAAAVAAAMLVVVFGILPGHRAGYHPPRHPVARVLAFIRHGRYIDVIVRNPYADPRRYRAEFRAHHLDISLRLVPASPSIVGTVVYFQGNNSLKVITRTGRCWTGGGGNICPIGFRVPVHYRGSAMLVFGRPAKPGEKYESTAPSTDRGEVLHGLHIVGRHVGTVLRLIRTRHVRVAVYNISTSSGGKLVHHVPLSWFVYEVDPWAPGQVMVFASPTRRPSPSAVPQPATGSPTPTPSPG